MTWVYVSADLSKFYRVRSQHLLQPCPQSLFLLHQYSPPIPVHAPVSNPPPKSLCWHPGPIFTCLTLSSSYPNATLKSPTSVLVRITHASLSSGGSIMMQLCPFKFIRSRPSIPELDFSGIVPSIDSLCTQYTRSFTWSPRRRLCTCSSASYRWHRRADAIHRCRGLKRSYQTQRHFSGAGSWIRCVGVHGAHADYTGRA
jgi:hypothetical protein